MRKLDDLCSRHFKYRELIECGKTWHELASGTRRVDNVPLEVGTWEGIELVAQSILDPITDALSRPTLTYGFSSPRLARRIGRRIAPALDQHAGCERKRSGKLVCDRGGQAVDLTVPGRSAAEVAIWIVEHLPFDRLYFFGADRPIHVSACQSGHRSVVLMLERPGRPRVPRAIPLARARAALEAFVLAPRSDDE